MSNLVGTGADDLLQGDVDADTISGLAGADRVIGAGGDDSLSGGDGDDRLHGFDGRDTIDGGAGSDTIQGGQGDDLLDGGAGTDVLSFDDSRFGVTVSLAITTGQTISPDDGVDVIRGFETILGGTWDDHLTGDGQANVLKGEHGSDTLEGGGGADTLQGGLLGDLIFGGDGDDRIIVEGGPDTIYGGAGVDTLVIAGGASADDAGRAVHSVMDWSREDQLLFIGSTTRPYAEATAVDYASAHSKADELARTGIDVVAVQVGGDVFVFGSPDTAHSRLGEAVELVGRSLDDISGVNVGAPAAPPPPPPAPAASPPPSGPASLSTQVNLTGNMDAPHLNALLNSTILKASSSEFLADGGGNRIQLLGGPFNYEDPGNLITGPVTNLAYSSADLLQITAKFSVPASSTPFGSWLEHDVTQGAFANLFSGADSMTGSGGADLIRSWSSADVVAGAGGADTIFGGSQNDVIYAGLPSGEAVAAGATYLRGDDGDDNILGGAAFDDINGNMGDDTAAGGLGDDWVVGGKDRDQLFGDQGDDIVYGNVGNDTCVGGEGADIVRGGQDNDVLYGEGGNDWLSGDRGDDTIVGGAGADVFHSFRDAGVDRVADFNAAEGDRIQLDAGTTYTLSQAGADVAIVMNSGGQLILSGVSPNTFNEAWIAIV